jgi:hypothetical protein
MKKVIAGLLTLGFAGAVYAQCTTQTIIIGGKMTTCTTCCSFGNCTTTCI